MNRVELKGRLGGDAEMKETKGGPMARCRLATSREWTDKQGVKQERTQWHTVIGWGRVAEIMRLHARKGMRVHVMGELEHREWQNQAGENRTSSEVVLRSFEPLVSRLIETAGEAGAGAGGPAPAAGLPAGDTRAPGAMPPGAAGMPPGAAPGMPPGAAPGAIPPGTPGMGHHAPPPGGGAAGSHSRGGGPGSRGIPRCGRSPGVRAGTGTGSVRRTGRGEAARRRHPVLTLP